MIAFAPAYTEARPETGRFPRRIDPVETPQAAGTGKCGRCGATGMCSFFPGSSAGGVRNIVSGAAGLSKGSPAGVFPYILKSGLLSDTYILIFCTECDIINC